MSAVERAWALSSSRLHFSGRWHDSDLSRSHHPRILRSSLETIPELGRGAAKRIPNAKLIEFPDLGYAPQIKAPDQVHEALLRGLGAL
jgi:pimeloyl-ACP methyl ester carboxylesterase